MDESFEQERCIDDRLKAAVTIQRTYRQWLKHKICEFGSSNQSIDNR